MNLSNRPSMKSGFRFENFDNFLYNVNLCVVVSHPSPTENVNAALHYPGAQWPTIGITVTQISHINYLIVCQIIATTHALQPDMCQCLGTGMIFPLISNGIQYEAAVHLPPGTGPFYLHKFIWSKFY